MAANDVQEIESTNLTDLPCEIINNILSLLSDNPNNYKDRLSFLIVVNYPEIANINKDVYYRIFYESIRQGLNHIVMYIINEGIDINADNEYALWVAVEYNHIHTVKLLIQYGANIKKNESCLLQNAARRGNVKMLSLLIDEGADYIKYIEVINYSALQSNHYNILYEILNRKPHRQA